MTNSYFPASFTGFLSWPVRRDDAPESKSDRILTMGIVGGIILLFIVPPTWWFIARTIRLRRARPKAKDVEQASLSLVRRKDVEGLPDYMTTYLILGICSGISLCIMLVWFIVICCRQRRLRDIEEAHELSTLEASPR
ncbi:hypothetical protein FAGAP_11298 [Fusarium agapanthi]|uniref:Uncharacterized protein n=1 Tax=Fusarium agapanthi TaxID=1803897 RepID=A0A9P5AZA7_9HYPO|nr:hypothetical protein FAGAP_11298 [Fusarium agapanthi]